MDGFFQVSIFAVMNGSVIVFEKAKPTTIDTWSSLRKLMKGSVYRSARLKPRLSDADFKGGEELPPVAGMRRRRRCRRSKSWAS